MCMGGIVHCMPLTFFFMKITAMITTVLPPLSTTMPAETLTPMTTVHTCRTKRKATHKQMRRENAIYSMCHTQHNDNQKLPLNSKINDYQRMVN